MVVDGGGWRGMGGDGRMVEVRRVGEWMDGWMNGEVGAMCC